MQILNRISLIGLSLGLLFFAASLTPSLIPRGVVLQGVLGGVVMALGALSWAIIMLLWRWADLPEFRGRLALGLSSGVLLGVVAIFLWTLGQSLIWQNDLRERMEAPIVEGGSLALIVAVGLAVFAGCFLLGFLLSGLVLIVRRRLYRIMPERRANVLGLILVVAVLFVLTRNGPYEALITGLDESYEAAQNLFDPEREAPANENKTGGPGSLVEWGAIGALGREFILDGPNAEAISAFTRAPAKDPIRVYVGRANAETPEERAGLALAELIRQGAFEREVLVVASPTGTGWLDPGSHDPLEYMHGGDVATVAVQYSYLLSPLALFLETDAGLDQATALLEVVHEYWKRLPPDTRPRLYAHGLSLGAWSSMFATNMFR
ncbi:MAG: alpha/beta-hydrolase family protein, partial [Pseudomonadota bacterium]